MQHIIEISTDKHQGLCDITARFREIVTQSGVTGGFVNIYVQGATAAIIIQENCNESV